MKKGIALLSVVFLFAWISLAHAVFDSGSTGADGPFNPSVDTEVILPAGGVLNYTTIDIPAGVTVTFKKNSDNTPVYMLATGDINIDGTLNVNGSDATTSVPGEGGPGGYKGGYGGPNSTAGGKGLGPGGGLSSTSQSPGTGGGFATKGQDYNNLSGGTPYGNERLFPMIGGSGGGGGYHYTQRNGGGGGGALLIASSTAIYVNGSISSNGGKGLYWASYDGGGGSGGAIKLVANTISGNGSITAIGGNCRSDGGLGRIRIETFAMNRTASTNPAYSFGEPSTLFPPSPPSLSITSIAGTAVPSSPTGAYNQPDILLPDTTVNPVTVDLSATNIPVGTTVSIWVIPQYGTSLSVDTFLSGTDQSSNASADVTLSTSYSNIVTAEATFTVLQALYWNGEEIEKVRIATTLNGTSETIYITESGREIAGELLAAAHY